MLTQKFRQYLQSGCSGGRGANSFKIYVSGQVKNAGSFAPRRNDHSPAHTTGRRIHGNCGPEEDHGRPQRRRERSTVRHQLPEDHQRGRARVKYCFEVRRYGYRPPGEPRGGEAGNPRKDAPGRISSDQCVTAEGASSHVKEEARPGVPVR
jgi:hypothetical protein